MKKVVQFQASTVRKPKAKAKAKAVAKAGGALGRGPAPAKRKPASADELRTIERIKLELPERIRRRREGNVTRSEVSDAHSRAGYAAELDRLHGEAGFHGAIPGHVAGRMQALAGALRVPLTNGLPTGVSSHYPSYHAML